MIEELAQHHYVFPLVRWDVELPDPDGSVLDIGGGGEGVIGRLLGPEVIAVDRQIRELIEAPDGPQKLVMDARQLGFPDRSFSTATAFFSLMYLGTERDQRHVFSEISRVVKPGGSFHLWDVDLVDPPDTHHKTYIVHLEYAVRGMVNETGYGSRWPLEARGLEHYRELAVAAGFAELSYRCVGNTFYLQLQKARIPQDELR